MKTHSTESQFPKLEQVARRQRRLMRLNTLVTFFFVSAAVAASMSGLLGCADAGPDPVDDAVDAMNRGDGDAIDAFFSPDARQELIRLNAAAGPRPLRYRLLHAAPDRGQATLVAAPERASEAGYRVELAVSRETGIVEHLTFAPVSSSR